MHRSPWSTVSIIDLIDTSQRAALLQENGTVAMAGETLATFV
jgi:hypothetical protein